VVDFCGAGGETGESKAFVFALYDVSSAKEGEKEGGGGARGTWYASAVGTSGEGNEVRLEAGYDVRLEEGRSGLAEAADGGRDGKSCDNRSDPEVFWRMRGGRSCVPGLWTTGEPARSADGTESLEPFLVMAGEPTRRGVGTPSMAALCAPRLSQYAPVQCEIEGIQRGCNN
jgi:hypothetical protein